MVVDTALRIADEEGIGALSMRRIGAELGIAAMSLYNHVAGKEQLLELVADRVYETVAPIDPDAPWDVAVLDFFSRLYTELRAHPAAAHVASLQPTAGPAAMRHNAEVRQVLRGALGRRLGEEAFTALSCYTLGAVLFTSARKATPPDRFRSGLEHLVRGYALG